jgi:hypothetical protein
LQSTGSVTGTGWPPRVMFAGGVAGGGVAGAGAAGEPGFPLALDDGAELVDVGAGVLLPLEQPATPAIAVVATTAINSSRFNRSLPCSR